MNIFVTNQQDSFKDKSKLITDMEPDLSDIREFCKGGQKTVFKARFNSNTDVVLKILHITKPEKRKKALREIEIASKLNSPNFTKIYSYDEFSFNSNSYMYVIEEYIDGKDLREILDQNEYRSLPMDLIRRIISNLINCLEIIDSHNLVHRDIKPENIIVNSERVVLIDFGFATSMDQESTNSRFVFFGPGTPGYSPPEQIKNEKDKISIRSDFFSLGTVFYEMLTGFNPFIDTGRRDLSSTVKNIFDLEPQPLSNLGYDKSFDDLVMSCIEKSPNNRPESVSELKKLFEKIRWE